MKIHVEMSEEEMQDFLQYRKEKKNRTAAQNRLRELAHEVLWAVGPVDGQSGNFAIIDQDHAEDLMEMAAMYVE